MRKAAVRRFVVAAFAVASLLVAVAPPAASVEPLTLRVGVVVPIGSLDLRDGTSDVAGRGQIIADSASLRNAGVVLGALRRGGARSL